MYSYCLRADALKSASKGQMANETAKTQTKLGCGNVNSGRWSFPIVVIELKPLHIFSSIQSHYEIAIARNIATPVGKSYKGLSARRQAGVSIGKISSYRYHTYTSILLFNTSDVVRCTAKYPCFRRRPRPDSSRQTHASRISSDR